MKLYRLLMKLACILVNAGEQVARLATWCECYENKERDDA